MMTLSIPGGSLYRPGTIYAFARTYHAHAAELKNPVPSNPVYFLKARSSLLPPGGCVPLPPGCQTLHYEVELVACVGERTTGPLSPEAALDCVVAYAVGIDFTDRTLQQSLKQRSLPWAAAKSFRGAAALSDLVPAASIGDPQSLSLSLSLNGDIKQSSSCQKMMWRVAELVSYLTQSHDLDAGDLIFTGTPEGVGPCTKGDQLEISLIGHVSASFQVI